MSYEYMNHDAEPSPTSGLSTPSAWPQEALKRFRLIFKAVQQHSLWVETHCGVSSAQIWFMGELSKSPGMRVTEIAKAMAIHQSTASNMLEKLAKKGLVIRERNRKDQRVVELYLTEAGREVLRQAPPLPTRGILQQALFNLPNENLASLCGTLDLLIAEMGFYDETAAMQPIKSLAIADTGEE